MLETLFVPQAPATTRGDNTVEERCTEQQAAKTTTRGKVASGHRTNSEQASQSRVESTQSTILDSKKTNTKAGPSRPYNEAGSGLPPRSAAPLRSQEKDQIGGGLKPMRNVFDRLARTLRKICVFAWTLGERRRHQRKMTCPCSPQSRRDQQAPKAARQARD